MYIILITIIILSIIFNLNKLKYIHSKIGVVITTHGNNGILLEQCIKSYLKFLPKNTSYFLFVNESYDKLTLSIRNKYPMINYIYIYDQVSNGGLTGTWNQGIDKCFQENCEIIILSNDDLIINSSINFILDECIKNKYNSSMYFGPTTNNPGPSYLNKLQGFKYTNTGVKKLNHNLNGFFMVFSKLTLLRNKYDPLHYFNPNFPFELAEVEWYNRFKKIGGVSILVSNTFIYHYKIKSWRKKNIQNNKCVVIIEKNRNDYTIIDKNLYMNMDILYFTDDFNNIYQCVKYNLIPIILFDKNKDLQHIKNLIPKNYTYISFAQNKIK